MVKKIQAFIKAYLGEKSDIMDTWDVEELMDILNNLRSIRGVVITIILKLFFVKKLLGLKILLIQFYFSFLLSNNIIFKFSVMPLLLIT